MKQNWQLNKDFGYPSLTKPIEIASPLYIFGFNGFR